MFFVAVAVVASVAVTGALVPATATTAGDDIFFGSASPSPDTTLSPGQTYNFDVTADYVLESSPDAEIQLIFEGSSISNNIRDTATVSSGDATVSLSASLTVPSDWNTNDDLQVTLLMRNDSDPIIAATTNHYNVDSPNTPPSIDSYSPSDTAYEVSKGTTESYSVSASDPDGDSLSYTWTVNDHNDDSGQQQVGTGASHSHPWDTVGDYTIRAKVHDGTTTVVQSWTVVVTETATPPTVTTDPPSSVGDAGATLHGVLDNTGSAGSADVHFEYREEGASTWQTTATRTLSGSAGFSETLSGLSPGTTYEYRAVASSPDGTDTGSVVTFTTTAEGNVFFESTTPSSGTALTPGETYAVDVTAGYTLSSASGGEIRLIFESISAGAEDVATVSSGEGTASLSASLTVPSDWNTNEDLQVTLQFVSGNGDTLDVQTQTYSVTSPNTPPTIDSHSPTDTAYEVTNGTTESYSVSASDEDGDPLSYDWYVNDLNDDSAGPQHVASGSGYTHTFDRVGDFTVRVEVNDGTTTVEEVWTVAVAPRDTNAPPSLSRVSPGSPSLTLSPDEQAGFEVEASDEDADLERIEWAVDGETVHTRFLTGSSPATDAYATSFPEAGTYTLTATVYDGNGNSDAVEWTVTVEGSDGPAVETGSAAGVGTANATLRGRLNDLAGAESADVYFEFRRRGDEAWQSTPARPRDATGGFEATVEGLSPDTTYEFRAVAETPAGRDAGALAAFTTDATATLDGDVGIVTAESSPSPGTELTAGEEAPLSLRVFHDLSGADSGTIELYFEGLSESAAGTLDVSAGEGYERVELTLAVPADYSGDLEVTFVLSAGGERLDADSVTYTVVPPGDNAAPTVDDLDPAETALDVEAGTARTFAVEASDGDGDDLTYVWYVSDLATDRAPKRVATGPSYTHAFGEPGEYSVRVAVDDGTTTVEQTWVVAVGGTTDGPPRLAGAPPTDPDDDGVYEDVNGNGRVDFADLVVLFEHLDDPAVREDPGPYDVDGDGRLGFPDVAAMFDALFGGETP